MSATSSEGPLRPASRMRRARIASLVLGVGCAIFSAQHVASADTVSKPDKNDAHGPLDVIRLRHGHSKRRAKILVHTIVTSGRWGKSDVRNKNSYLYLWFDTDGDRHAEHRIAVVNKGGRLTAQFQDYDESSDSAEVGPPRYLRFRRPSRREIRIFLPRKHLGVDRYRWSAETLYRNSSSRHCRFGQPLCHDKAPRGRGRGRILHVLG
jgi:hypothetical protein